MNLHEYQAKALFKAYGIPVPNNIAANSSEEARVAAENLDTDTFVVKAQIHARGRIKVGGIKMVDTPREAEDYAKSMLGTRLVTIHTHAAGQPVNTVLVEETCDVENELYLGMFVNPASKRIVVTGSTEGGQEIKQVKQDAPEKILEIELDPSVGIVPAQCHELATGLELSANQSDQFTQLLTGLSQLFIDKDLTLIEINPLVITKAGDLMCLDGRINVDDNALHRHKHLKAMRDDTQEVDS